MRVVRGEDVRTGFAEAVDDAFALVVRREDGTREPVTSEDVTVRGLFGFLVLILMLRLHRLYSSAAFLRGFSRH